MMGWWMKNWTGFEGKLSWCNQSWHLSAGTKEDHEIPHPAVMWNSILPYGRWYVEGIWEHWACFGVIVTVKKVVPLHAVKACVWSNGTFVLILNLSTRLKWVANFMPRPFAHRRGVWMGPRGSLDGSGKGYLVLLSRIEPWFKVAYVSVRDIKNSEDREYNVRWGSR
jgi:hypothetical protein